MFLFQARGAMKRRAADTQETPQQIISGCVQALSQAAATQMPDLSTVRRHMRRQRQRAGNPHPIPTDLSEMPIPQEYTVTSSNQQFLQADLQDPARLLLFASPEAVQLLQDSNHWFYLLMVHSKPAQTSSTRCIPSTP